MSFVKKAVRGIIRCIPKSKVLEACCRCYCEHCDGTHATDPGDPATNGEYRLLREMAPAFDTVLDIGANVGDWTAALLALRPSASIHAFEPSASAYDAILRRHFPENVVVHKMAISSMAGAASLHIFGDASGMNSLHNRHGLEGGYGIAPATRTEDVQLQTLDDFCASHGLKRVDFVKVDTEGHEVDVLRGGVQSLKTGMLHAIQFEYGGAYIDSRKLLKDAFEVFEGLDYVVFRIVPDGLVAYPRYDQRLETFQYNNFVALHRNKIGDTPSAMKAMQQVH